MFNKSGFSALCLSLAATLGTGNITGVAISLSIGGAGALFWMVVSAFFGMATKYAEGLLGVKYARGGVGGTFYFIEYGLGKKFKPLALCFAFCGMSAGIFGVGTAVQTSSIAECVRNISEIFKTNADTTALNILCGAVFAIFTAVVIFGGGKRTVTVTAYLVPIMAVLYFVLALGVIVVNYKNIPSATLSVFKSAFSLKSATGAAVGISVKTALREGISRGVFSNEAGLGTASLAPFRENTSSVSAGLVQMVSAFVDTAVLCTLSGMCILVTDATSGDCYGTEIVAKAFKTLPINENLSEILLYLCVILFAFSTIIGWNYYGERCYKYLFKSENFGLYRVLYCISVFFGAVINAKTVWQTADIFNALMVFPNVIAVILLRNDVKRETKRFFNK